MIIAPGTRSWTLHERVNDDWWRVWTYASEAYCEMMRKWLLDWTCVSWVQLSRLVLAPAQC